MARNDKRIDQLTPSTIPLVGTDLFAVYNANGTRNDTLDSITDYVGLNIVVTGITANDTYVTGSTLSGNTLVINRNQGLPVVSTDLSPILSGFSSVELWTAGSGTDAAVLTNSGGIASGITSVAEGNLTIAGGYASHAEGNLTIAGGYASHAEGNGSAANGETSHAEGKNTQANGEFSHSEGESATANGYASHAEGQSTNAVGQGSHAEGFNTTAIGLGSHAEGLSTTASSDEGAHAEGGGTLASNYYAHAEGENTVASGYASHAEGLSTLASGQASHAEGNATTASANYSHAEGQNTIASGLSSHAGGLDTTASGNTSFIHSTNSLVTGDRSVVLGGSGITGSSSDTVYVPNLNINTLGTGTPITNLGIDSSGNVVSATTGNTLAETLVLGNTTGGNGIIMTTGDVVKSSVGGGQLNLRDGVDDRITLTNDNGSQGQVGIYIDGTTEITVFSDGWNSSFGFNFGGDFDLTNQHSSEANRIIQLGVNGDRSLYLADNTNLPRTTYNVDNHSTFLGTNGSTMLSGVTNSVILGGQNIIGTTDDTVYVPNLNIDTVGTGTPNFNLGLDSSGNVVTGTTGGGSFTGNTSGDCITDLYVSNIHSCSPLNINPNDEGWVHFGSTSAITVDLTNDRLIVGENLGWAVHDINIVTSGGKIGFGDNGPLVTGATLGTSINCFVGEHGGNVAPFNADTDILHLHGKKGIKITHGNYMGGELEAISITNGGGFGNAPAMIGLGTTNPTEKLEVSGNTKISGTLNIGTLSTTPDSGGTETLTIDTNGTVIKGYTTLTYEIGDWNMSTTSQVSVSHGLSAIEWKSIKKIDTIIVDSTDSWRYPLDHVDISTGTMEGSVNAYNNSDIYLHRRGGGFFTSGAFSNTGTTRGYLTVDYIKD